MDNDTYKITINIGSHGIGTKHSCSIEDDVIDSIVTAESRKFRCDTMLDTVGRIARWLDIPDINQNPEDVRYLCKMSEAIENMYNRESCKGVTGKEITRPERCRNTIG